MLLSIALIVLIGLVLGELFQKLHMPYIIGMLATGVLIGPFMLSLLDEKTLAISVDIRQMALVVILAKAGLSLDVKDLRRIGRPAVLLCFLPATLEIAAFLLLAPKIMGITLLEAGILGAVMSAVSPAIVVPRMVRFMEEGRGVKKGVPQMIVAGASADDVYVIVLFTALVSLAGGGSLHAGDLLRVPVSILLGAVGGALAGFILSLLFTLMHMRDTVKLMIILASSFLLLCLEDALEGIIGFSGLLAVMGMCVFLKMRVPVASKRLTYKFSKLWVVAEIFLFVLVGATVDVRAVLEAGLPMLLMLIIGLAFRLFGTWISVLGTNLGPQERGFCLLAEIPKATVQAAIGGVPLALGLACGETVLAFSVLSILITAPLGAWCIDWAGERWLRQDRKDENNITISETMYAEKGQIENET